MGGVASGRFLAQGACFLQLLVSRLLVWNLDELNLVPDCNTLQFVHIVLNSFVPLFLIERVVLGLNDFKLADRLCSYCNTPEHAAGLAKLPEDDAASVLRKQAEDDWVLSVDVLFPWTESRRTEHESEQRKEYGAHIGSSRRNSTTKRLVGPRRLPWKPG